MKLDLEFGLGLEAEIASALASASWDLTSTSASASWVLTSAWASAST